VRLQSAFGGLISRSDTRTVLVMGTESAAALEAEISDCNAIPLLEDPPPAGRPPAAGARPPVRVPLGTLSLRGPLAVVHERPRDAVAGPPRGQLGTGRPAGGATVPPPVARSSVRFSRVEVACDSRAGLGPVPGWPSRTTLLEDNSERHWREAGRDFFSSHSPHVLTGAELAGMADGDRAVTLSLLRWDPAASWPGGPAPPGPSQLTAASAAAAAAPLRARGDPAGTQVAAPPPGSPFSPGGEGRKENEPPAGGRGAAGRRQAFTVRMAPRRGPAPKPVTGRFRSVEQSAGRRVRLDGGFQGAVHFPTWPAQPDDVSAAHVSPAGSPGAPTAAAELLPPPPAGAAVASLGHSALPMVAAPGSPLAAVSPLHPERGPGDHGYRVHELPTGAGWLSQGSHESVPVGPSGPGAARLGHRRHPQVRLEAGPQGTPPSPADEGRAGAGGRKRRGPGEATPQDTTPQLDAAGGAGGGAGPTPPTGPHAPAQR